MIIVESQNEIDDFLNQWETQSSLVIPIWSDLECHPMNTNLSFLYVRFKDGKYIIPFNHNDCENIQIDLSSSTSPTTRHCVLRAKSFTNATAASPAPKTMTGLPCLNVTP